RRPRGGAEEVRPGRGAASVPVLQALSPPGKPRDVGRSPGRVTCSPKMGCVGAAARVRWRRPDQGSHFIAQRSRRPKLLGRAAGAVPGRWPAMTCMVAAARGRAEPAEVSVGYRIQPSASTFFTQLRALCEAAVEGRGPDVAFYLGQVAVGVEALSINPLFQAVLRQQHGSPAPADLDQGGQLVLVWLRAAAMFAGVPAPARPDGRA